VTVRALEEPGTPDDSDERDRNTDRRSRRLVALKAGFIRARSFRIRRRLANQHRPDWRSALRESLTPAAQWVVNAMNAVLQSPPDILELGDLHPALEELAAAPPRDLIGQQLHAVILDRDRAHWKPWKILLVEGGATKRTQLCPRPWTDLRPGSSAMTTHAIDDDQRASQADTASSR